MEPGALSERATIGSRFTGKTAIVTGGAGDLGRAVAGRLAAEGAAVLVVDVDESGLQDTADVIRGNGGTAQRFVADVTNPASVQRYVDEAARLGRGTVDAFFNNAGIERSVTPIDAYDESVFDKVIAVNVRGVFLGLRYVAPRMSYGGAIVNTSSVAGLVGFPGGAAYVASKHAVIGLTRVAALDLAPRGVRVNAISPGPLEGRMMTSLEDQMGLDNARSALLSGVPLGRYGTPGGLASTVAFLLSDEANFATGATFVIDGGQTIQ